MKNITLAAIAFALVFATSCKENKKEEVKETEVEEVVKEASTKKELTISLSPKSDSQVEGTVTFKEKDGIVSMTAYMTGLSEGEHAIHIHEKADCTSPDGKSSGGHWNPTGQPHGKWNAETGYHKGDIGNFKVVADGKGTVTMTTDQWCIGCGDETKDILGKAVIVHEGTDDYTSQPSGAAGARVSCAGIIE
ncbi:superoxide dismutase family protein [Winogradskyella luteola]|uniref:Superoxide dismutase family protein n=1 Tax=Winogradskyella luteola TaxID=2828330 RepID=A0A9X1F9S9_9FLAO|nr:superoxide dismutase family protein [Winogradskyella luteola]MBV7268580.1 superoxide dismutase family protein [Winogradskyella luteola]